MEEVGIWERGARIEESSAGIEEGREEVHRNSTYVP